jgi:N-methylhydantoinase B
VSPGGGGYGRPLDRDPLLVASDVAEGFLEADAAARIYGVVVSDTGALDVAATERRRTELARGDDGVADA